MTTETEVKAVSFDSVLDAFDAMTMDSGAAKKFLKDLERVVRQNVENFHGTLNVLNERQAPAAAAADFNVTYEQDENSLTLTLTVVIMAEGDGFILFAADKPDAAVELENAVQGARWLFELFVETLNSTRTREFVVAHLNQEG